MNRAVGIITDYVASGSFADLAEKGVNRQFGVKAVYFFNKFNKSLFFKENSIQINISETKIKHSANNLPLSYDCKAKQKEMERKEMAKSKLAVSNEKIAEGVVGGYKKIEEGVVGGYKKIEKGAVDGFNKVADKFVDRFLTKEGETVEEAKKRLNEEQKAREAEKIL